MSGGRCAIGAGWGSAGGPAVCGRAAMRRAGASARLCVARGRKCALVCGARAQVRACDYVSVCV